LRLHCVLQTLNAGTREDDTGFLKRADTTTHSFEINLFDKKVLKKLKIALEKDETYPSLGNVTKRTPPLKTTLEKVF